ncbi:Serine/threonine-protein kinase BLUS1 [Rhizoctonia solani]|uniref:Serine/threonine-protein kinase BLUS1 n=1 Tax=Rhizoctonia solani TaxID=456999 RepID=A0A0K6G0N5_9AGAM|nr:Serine/threonine-protein kinase BLUS1 [Rhizoctonia solani]
MIASGSKHVSSIDANNNSHPEEIYGINNGSFDETISIISLYGKLYAQSHASEAESAMISGSMPPSIVITRLSQHGCNDLTSELDPRSVSKGMISTGGSGDVYRGALYDGRRVGIKCLRILIGMSEEGEKQVKRAARELYIWSKCKHPNIQELTGVALHDDRVAMISPWMKNGHLSWYTSRNPEVDRYNLLVQTAAAVAYLRENGIVHGDIKAQNFLVSDDHTVKLTDFGNSIISLCSLRFTASTSASNVTLRWTAPEIFLGETRHTFEGDVYALGMTMLEIITGSVPWEGMLDVTVMHNLNKRTHPSRPEISMPVGYQPSDRLWELMTKCWASEPRQRPYATKVWNELEEIMKQHQLAGLTHVNTHRVPDNIEGPTDLISSNVPASGELLRSSPAQKTRNIWFWKRNSKTAYDHLIGPAAESTRCASNPDTCAEERIEERLQHRLKVLEKRKIQEERFRAQSKMVMAKRELMLITGNYEPGDWTDPLTMSRLSASRQRRSIITVATSKTDPGPRQPLQRDTSKETDVLPTPLRAIPSARPRARSLIPFEQLTFAVTPAGGRTQR